MTYPQPRAYAGRARSALSSTRTSGREAVQHGDADMESTSGPTRCGDLLQVVFGLRSGAASGAKSRRAQTMDERVRMVAKVNGANEFRKTETEGKR